MEAKSELPGLWDIHSHFLPGVDDGCQTVDESAQLLKLCVEQGVTGIVATPHYYPEETISEFLDRRQKSAEALATRMRGEACPKVCLGAEVAYHPGLIYDDDIQDLCIGDSHYMLLEMPFSRWTPSVMRNVVSLRHVQGVVPVLAHLERYIGFQDRHLVEELLDSGVMVQMNAEYILNVKTRRKAIKMIRRGFVDVLGSDCHNLTHRAPNLAAAAQRLCAVGLGDFMEQAVENIQDILEEAMD